MLVTIYEEVIQDAEVLSTIVSELFGYHCLSEILLCAQIMVQDGDVRGVVT